MKRTAFLIGMLLFELSSSAQSTDADSAFRALVGTCLDEWHDDAAHARVRYFDKSERWKRDDFKVWAKAYFDKGRRGHSKPSSAISIFPATGVSFGLTNSTTCKWESARPPV